ncbi:MAG: PEP-CTERM sorting domain-containing protein [Isosphaeraceae bacterium]
MRLRALLFLGALATPLAASADIDIGAPAFKPPPRGSIGCSPGGPADGPGSELDHDYAGRLWLRGLRSYSTTGHVPDSAVWKYLQRRHDLHPAAFNAAPYFQGLFRAPDTVGELPTGTFWNRLEKQYEDRPILFERRFPYLNEILDRDRETELAGHTPGVLIHPQSVLISPPSFPPPEVPNRPHGGGPSLSGAPTVNAIPEPASIVLVAGGLGGLALFAARVRKRAGRA